MPNWIQLTSGGGYDFDSKSIVGRWSLEEDLAWPLSGENRYAGHTLKRWAVAIHSVAVARFMEAKWGPAAGMAGLLHDAHESVIGDVPTPVARVIGYDKVEQLKEAVQLAIEMKLDIPFNKRPLTWTKQVKQADIAALHIERQLLMKPGIWTWGYPEPDPEDAQMMHDICLNILTSGEDDDGGRRAFLEEFSRLGNVAVLLPEPDEDGEVS